MRTIFIILLFIPLNVFTQNEAKHIREGNKAYKEGDFKKAEINYRKSLEKNDQSIKGSFNLGDALYEQKDYKNSQEQFDILSKKIKNPIQLAETFHNLGNSYLAADKYQESIDAFKNALRNNPNDLDTKYNLEYARQKLQQQKQNQNKEQNQDKEQNQKNQDQQDQQNNQEQNQKEDEENQQQQNQQQLKQISKEDAEKMLQALKNEEKKTIEKLKKEQAKNAKVIKLEKDW